MKKKQYQLVINQEIKIEEDYKLVPKNGVYIVSSVFENKTVYGMMNIGKNPTVDGVSDSIEIHYFDFSCFTFQIPATIKKHFAGIK